MNFKKYSTRKKAILALVIANIIWGAASPIFKYSLENIPPFTLAFLRFGIAALILFPFVKREFLNLSNEKQFIKPIIFYSFFGVTFNIIFFFLALRMTESINAPIIGSSGPILTIVFSSLFLKEKISLKKLIGTIVSFIGVFIIIVEPLFESGIKGSILGNLFLILATIGAVGQTLIGRNLTQKYYPLPLTFISFVIGTITFIPLSFTELFNMPILNIKAAVGIIYGAIFSSLIAYSLYAWGLSKIQAHEASIFAYIDPVIAILIAYPLLGEVPQPLFIIGALFVFVGIYIAEKRIHWHPINLFKRKD